MATLKDCTLTFPEAPPKPTPMPDPEPIYGPKGDPKKGGLWGSHDPAIYHDPVSGNYYTYCTGANLRRSPDMIQWESLGKCVPETLPESAEWVGSDAIWAPDIVKVGNEYRLYCSNSTWGVKQSAIFLAVSDNAEGPFVGRGCVIKTSEQLPVNAIDANIIADEETGEQYMLYGSFWGGMHILKLDIETGLAAEEGIGKCVARRPQWADCAIEGPYIRYNPDTGYYYLFVSYGSLKTDYNIRVGRSKNVTGPYYDHNGRDLCDVDDFNNEVGYLLACGYKFNDGQAWMGPGHNSVLCDDDGRWYLVCHIRPHNFKEVPMSTMHIYQMFWSADGWPMACPEVYAGEKAQPVKREWMVGHYERIKLVPQVPQGVLNAVPMELLEDGRMECCSIRGHWELPDENTLVISYGNIVETYAITPAWDWQKWEPTIAITGKDQKGIAVWGKRADTVVPVIETPNPPDYVNEIQR